MKCEECNAFQRRNPKGGVCRANPPTLMVFGMEQVNVPGLRPGSQGMRPLTGTGFPETANDGWCRQFQPAPNTPDFPKFDPSKMKQQGEAHGLNVQDVMEGTNTDGRLS